MTKPADPYSRVYWRIVDDERFADIYGSDAHLAAWLRLLLGADQAWPASAAIPASVRRASVKALADCGLVELRPGGFYRIHGLEAERSRRVAHAERAASIRHSSGDAHGTGEQPVSNAHGMPRLVETSKDEEETSIATGEDAFADYYALTIRYPRGRTEEWLKELVAEFGDGQVGKALAAEWSASTEIRTFLSRTEVHLRSMAHNAERERSRPKPKPVVTPEDAARFEEQRKAILADLMKVKDVG
jgi:hypothetical protein